MIVSIKLLGTAKITLNQSSSGFFLSFISLITFVALTMPEAQARKSKCPGFIAPPPTVFEYMIRTNGVQDMYYHSKEHRRSPLVSINYRKNSADKYEFWNAEIPVPNSFKSVSYEDPRRGMDIPKACGTNISSLLKLTNVGRDSYWFTTYNDPCSNELVGYFTYDSRMLNFLKDTHGSFARTIEAIQDTTKGVCGKSPKSIRYYLNDPRLGANENYLPRNAHPIPGFYPVYSGRITFNEKGEYKLVDDDLTLRKKFGLLASYEDQIERFDRLTKPHKVISVTKSTNGATPNDLSFLGADLVEYSPETSFRSGAANVVSLRTNLGVALRVKSLNEGGALCSAGMKAGDIIWTIRSYKHNPHMRKVGGYWESYSLEHNELIRILSNFRQGEQISLVWTGSDYQELQSSAVTVRKNLVLRNKKVASCRPDPTVMKQHNKNGETLHHINARGDISPLVKSFKDSAKYAQTLIDHIDHVKGSTNNWPDLVRAAFASGFEMPPQWYDLRVDSVIFKGTPYTELLDTNYAPINSWYGKELHPDLPPNEVYGGQQVNELANSILRYSFEKWMPGFKLSDELKKSTFVPYKKDAILALRGFGRPGITDPSYRSWIASWRTQGNFPNGSFFLERIDQQTLARWTGKHNFSSLPRAEQERLAYKLSRFPTPDVLKSRVFEEAVNDYYEWNMGVLGYWNRLRQGYHPESAGRTWNSAFGRLSRDDHLRAYLQHHSLEWEKYVDTEWKNKFWHSPTQRLIHDVTMATLQSTLSSEQYQQIMSQLVGEHSYISTYETAVVRVSNDEYTKRYFEFLENLKFIEYFRHVKPGTVYRG